LSTTAYFLGIISSILALALVIEMLRRRRLRERHAIWWLIAGIMAVIVGIFPQSLVWASNLLGIEVPTNLVFFVSILVLFFVALQHSSELTSLESKTRKLAENVTLLADKVSLLEKKLKIKNKK
jgi:hypothetical protein